MVQASLLQPALRTRILLKVADLIEAHAKELAQLETLEREAYAPVERLLLEGVRHDPHLERPESVIAATADFTERLFRLHEPRHAT